MVAFVSLFLTLVSGVHPVTLMVDGGVMEVELVLDGKPIGLIRSEPWTIPCDFGAELQPHELVAIGRDAQGAEVARAVQWINLPRSRSEVGIRLEKVPEGQHRKHVVLYWESIDRREPDEISVSFDGRPVPTDYPETSHPDTALSGTAQPRNPQPFRVELPEYDSKETHLIVATFRFGSSETTTELLIGGARGGHAQAEMTAIPVVRKKLRKIPQSPQQLAGWFLKAGQPLEVTAIERGASELIVVHDLSHKVKDRLDSLGADATRFVSRRSPGGGTTVTDLSISADESDHVRALLPLTGVSQATRPTEMFPVTPALRGDPLTIIRVAVSPHYYLDKFRVREHFPSEQKIADAVAVAGLVAATGCRARAVVVIADNRTEDSSALTPQLAEKYLHSLHVPLVVWAPGRKTYSGPWGEAVRISNDRRMFEAASDLRSLLDRQVVIWVSGRHLPQKIELSPEAQKSCRLVGGRVNPSDV